MTNRAGVLETIASAIEASAATLTLRRKRERGPGAAGAMRETEFGVERASASGGGKRLMQGASNRHRAPPLPLAGEGRGGGSRTIDGDAGNRQEYGALAD